MSKILVIDDEKSTRLLLARVLQRSGHTTIEAGDGRLGWEILDSNSDIELVVADMIMPVIGGRELVHLIRQDARFASLPIVITSGIVSVHQVTDILQRGEVRFLSKPVKASHLLEYVEKLLAQRKEEEMTEGYQ